MCFISSCLYAQSSHIPRGVNGASFETGITLENWHLADAYGRLSYSIGGILDVGAGVQYGFTSVGGASAYDVRLAIHYSTIALKQDDSTPISARISGAYGFSKVGSAFLTDNDLEKEGIGYDIGLALYRDFYITPDFAVRMGARADFHSYSYTTSLIYTPPETQITQYPVFQREEMFYFGGEIGTSVQVTPRIGLALMAAMIFDSNMVPILRPDFRVITMQ